MHLFVLSQVNLFVHLLFCLYDFQTKSSGILGIQLILVSATMPKDLKNILENTVNVEGFTKCCTAHLHHVLGHVSQKFHRLSHADKPGTFGFV